MRQAPFASAGKPSWLTSLLEMPPQSERTLRMESLIARLRIVVITCNAVALAFFLDTTGWNLGFAWALVLFTFVYATPIVLFQPYRRWRLFQTSVASAFCDSAAVALFIAATGGADSPYYPLFFLTLAGVGLRFDLRQVIAVCTVYSLSYALVFLWTWDASANAAGLLLMRCAYLYILGVAVGHLAHEESSRSQEVEAFEKLNVENQKLLTRREKEARVDRLTGLSNRATLEKEGHRVVRRTKTVGGYLSVLFCDMDRLKAINDELGHDAGDRVLRQAGAIMKRTLRATDFVGRYGGDEFVVVLPNLTRETAFERAEQLIAGFKQINELLPEDLHVGLSVGIATFPFDAEDYPTLVKIADQAMYLAKRDGGNRVRTANDLHLFWETVPRTA